MQRGSEATTTMLASHEACTAWRRATPSSTLLPRCADHHRNAELKLSEHRTTSTAGRHQHYEIVVLLTFK
eukprot:6438256-Amphidinium_carterae.1